MRFHHHYYNWVDVLMPISFSLVCIAVAVVLFALAWCLLRRA